MNHRLLNDGAGRVFRLSLCFFVAFTVFGTMTENVSSETIRSDLANKKSESEWSPAKESERLAKALKEARTQLEAEAVIYNILNRMGIGVYNLQLRPRIVGNEQSNEDFYLFDYQVSIMANAFLNKTYITMNSFAQAMGLLGVPLPQEGNVTQPITPIELERLLRKARKWAEDNPKDHLGFPILLIDELGDRKESKDAEENNSFNLLSGGSGSGNTGASTKASKGKQGTSSDTEDKRRRNILTQSLAGDIDDSAHIGDTSTEQALRGIQDSEEKQAALAHAMKSGDMFDMMSAFMSKEQLKKMNQQMEKVRQELEKAQQESHAHPGDKPKESTAFLQSATEMMTLMQKGTDGRGAKLSKFAQSSEKLQKDTKAMLMLRQRKMEEALARPRKEVTTVQELYEQASDEASTRYALFELTQQIEEIEQQQEILSHTKENLKEAEKRQKKIMAMYPVDKEKNNQSDILLDPVQAFIITIDLLLPQRPARERSSLQVYYDLKPSVLLASTANPYLHTASLGDTCSQIKDAWDKIGRYDSEDFTPDLQGLAAQLLEASGVVKKGKSITSSAVSKTAYKALEDTVRKGGTKALKGIAPELISKLGSGVSEALDILNPAKIAIDAVASLIDNLSYEVKTRVVYPQQPYHASHKRGEAKNRERIKIEAELRAQINLGDIWDEIQDSTLVKCKEFLPPITDEVNQILDMPLDGGRLKRKGNPFRFRHINPAKYLWSDYSRFDNGPPFTKLSDTNGMAIGQYMAAVEEPYNYSIGQLNWKQPIEHAYINVSAVPKLPEDLFDILSIGNVISISLVGIFELVSTKTHVEIQYHEATPLEGSLSVFLDISEQFGSPIIRQSLTSTSEKSRQGIWTIELNFPDIKLTREGHSHSKEGLEFNYKIEGELMTDEKDTWEGECDDMPRTFKKVTTGQAKISNSGKGRALVTILPYVPSLPEANIKLSLLTPFSEMIEGKLRETVEEDTCEGTDKKTFEWDLSEKLPFPFKEKRTFVTEAANLKEQFSEISGQKSFPSKKNELSYNMGGYMLWNLRPEGSKKDATDRQIDAVKQRAAKKYMQQQGGKKQNSLKRFR